MQIGDKVKVINHSTMYDGLVGLINKVDKYYCTIKTPKGLFSFPKLNLKVLSSRRIPSSRTVVVTPKFEGPYIEVPVKDVQFLFDIIRGLKSTNETFIELEARWRDSL